MRLVVTQLRMEFYRGHYKSIYGLEQSIYLVCLSVISKAVNTLYHFVSWIIRIKAQFIIKCFVSIAVH